MKKFLACTVAAIIAASMMTACGDSSDDTSSSKAETTTPTTTAAKESEAESEAEESVAESAAEESAAESEAESDESAAEGEEATEPKPISEMPATLQDLETASLVFDTSMDPADFVKCMAENDWEGTDESHCEFSIEEVEDVPMLRVQVLDLKDPEDPTLGYKIPKIQFDVSKIFGGDADKIGSIFTVEIEFMTKAVGPFTADDGTESMVPGNFMGALVSQPGSDPDSLSWKELDNQIAESEWTSEWGTYKFTVRPGLMGPYEAVDSTQYFTFMRWSIPNQQDFYIADITFKDEDNNVIAAAIGPNAE